MKPYFETVRSFFTATRIVSIVVIAALGGGAYYYAARNDSAVRVAAVTSGEFLQQVSVSGKVIASDDVALSFSQSGRITAINVTVGDAVRSGQILASIENGDQRAAVLQRQAAVEVQEAKLATLKEGTRSEQIAVSESTVESNRVALAQAKQAIVDAIRNAYTKSDDAVHNKLDQYMNAPRSSNPQVVFFSSDSAMTGRLSSLRIEAESALTVWQSDYLALSAEADVFASADRAYTNLRLMQDLLSTASMALNRAIVTQTVTQTIIDGYVADTATARSNVDTALSSLTSAVTAGKAAATALSVAEKNLTLQKAGTVQSDINAQAAQVRSAQADLASAQAQLAKTIIAAPFSGVITSLSAVRGLSATANVPILTMIAPQTIQVESYIPESQIGLVRVGDPAEVRLDALPERTLAAAVVAIDPAATVRDGVSTYRTILHLTTGKADARSGMTGDVVITTEKRSGVISVPQGLIIARDGKKFVRLLVGETTIEREVVTGETSSLGTVEIISGLSAGETLVVSND